MTCSAFLEPMQCPADHSNTMSLNFMLTFPLSVLPIGHPASTPWIRFLTFSSGELLLTWKVPPPSTGSPSHNHHINC